MDKVIDIFQFTHFRKYLDEYQAARVVSDPDFTRAGACVLLGLPKTRSYYNDIVKGKKLSARMIPKFVEVLGLGHNPELFRCRDGSFAVYCIDSKTQAHVYRSASVNGPWKYERLPLDLNGRKLIEGESNFSFTRRPDGSVLAVCRGGAIWLSEDGIKPFVMMTGRVYPDVAGRFEDPVLWRDEVQYHLVVNDWLGRVAWYLTSPDGFNWTTQPGEAYRPGIARVAGGVTNEWFKYERMRVTTDVYGRVFQANFAVIDCVKREDRGGDIHSSKNITIPVRGPRRRHPFVEEHHGSGESRTPRADIPEDAPRMGDAHHEGARVQSADRRRCRKRDVRPAVDGRVRRRSEARRDGRGERRSRPDLPAHRA